MNVPREDSGKSQCQSNLAEHPEKETAPPSEKGEKTTTKPLQQPNLKIKQPTLSKFVNPVNTSLGHPLIQLLLLQSSWEIHSSQKHYY